MVKSNMDTMRNIFSSPENDVRVRKFLSKESIDYDSLPASVKQKIRVANNVGLTKKNGEGEYLFSGLMAQLGTKEGFALVNRHMRTNTLQLSFGHCSVFNEVAISIPKTVVTDDILLAIRMLSAGISAVAVGNTKKYFMEVLDDKKYRLNNPEYVLAISNPKLERMFENGLNSRRIPYSNLREGTRTSNIDSAKFALMKDIYCKHCVMQPYEMPLFEYSQEEFQNGKKGD